jgi:hypothetical protein
MALASAASAGCNAERKAECDQFLAAMKPLGEGVPTVDTVKSVQRAVAALSLQDQPLRVYAKNYAATLTILSNTLELKATPSPPDGTDDVIKSHLKEALTDAADTARYCAQ